VGFTFKAGCRANLVIRVTAHEYAHAWQGENCPLLDDPLLREGFAEWVAYRVLEYYRLDRQLDLMLKRCSS
jgi:aminopeptidase N